MLDENHLIAAVRYIERNPVRAGIVRDAWEYLWSSAAYHAGKTDQDRIIESDDMLRELIKDWKSYLRDDDQKDFLNSVRRDSFVNRPLGDEAFVSDPEKRFQLRLARGKVGRPVKAGKRGKKGVAVLHLHKIGKNLRLHPTCVIMFTMDMEAPPFAKRICGKSFPPR